MLKLSAVSAAYGPVVALHDVSLEVSEGQIITILGANGAGKSSTLRVISGLVRPTGGSVEFLGERIDRHSPEALVSLGISHVPEGRELFADLTVLENLQLGAYVRRDGDDIKRDLDRMYERFPVLAQRRQQAAGSLSGGEQQMLAVARGLMSRPRLLLLDEPSLGLAPLVMREIFRIFQTINQEDKVTILLVEQNATLALSVNMQGFAMDEFSERVSYMVNKVAGADTSRPVACITLYPYFRDFGIEPVGQYGGTPEEYRQALREAVSTCPHPNVHLIEGPEILTDISGLTADLIHPGDNGMIEMGRNLAAKLSPLL